MFVIINETILLTNPGHHHCLNSSRARVFTQKKARHPSSIFELFQQTLQPFFTYFLSVISMTLILILSGDIEQNPGPYSFVSIIRATFHQGNQKFGTTRGTQCTCIALYGICFSVIKSIARWNENDLESVVEKGDLLYKKQPEGTFLSCADLPRLVEIENLSLPVSFENDIISFIDNRPDSQTELIRNLSTIYSFSAVLFIIKGYGFSIVSKCNMLYLVDSHSRDDMGLPAADGSAIILKFANLVDLTNYITYVYHGNAESETQYDIQFIQVSCENITSVEWYTALRKHKSESQLRSFKTTRKKLSANKLW